MKECRCEPLACDKQMFLESEGDQQKNITLMLRANHVGFCEEPSLSKMMCFDRRQIKHPRSYSGNIEQMQSARIGAYVLREGRGSTGA